MGKVRVMTYCIEVWHHEAEMDIFRKPFKAIADFSRWSAHSITAILVFAFPDGNKAPNIYPLNSNPEFLKLLYKPGGIVRMHDEFFARKIDRVVSK